ncbi:unnamed protein product [Mytilus coruscus]|uniref:MRC n=1 Tax=Mytilus coruscus TaxID=42192 RepID=A0A6J8C4B5_MYTCO|nr:unnamed protein product [Mytilus coruscus]
MFAFPDYYALISEATTLYIEPLTWNDANKYCTSKGQNLVTIGRQAKERYLQEAILEKNPSLKELWIGLHVPDSNQPTKLVWTNTCFPPYWYSNWSPSLKSGKNDLCAFVKVESGSMYWFLDECGKATRPFICESFFTAICSPRSDIFYDTEGETTVPTAMNGQNNEKSPGTELECKTDCSRDHKCWGFAFTPSIPKCVMYDQIDDPFYTENNKVYSSGETLYMKRCNFELNIDTNVLSVPPYDDCGSAVVSKCVSCVAAIEETTTQKQTTTFKVSSAEKTTETTALTTETHVTPTVDVTSSDLHTTKSQSKTTSTQKSSIQQTTENHVTYALEVTSSHVQTTTSQTETTSIAKTFIFPTAQITTINTGKLPYCVCTCNNGTKQISLEESINEIVNEIKVDRSKTSAYTRKHTSAWDSRKSSASIGFVGIAILISIASLLLCLDSTSLIRRIFVLLRKPCTS